jgi:hypothetical protein
MATDTFGNLYVCLNNFPNQYVYIYPWGSTSVGTQAQLLAGQSCSGIAVDGAGYIYVADNTNQAVEVFAPPGLNAGSVVATNTRTITQAQGGFTTLWRLALDSLGRIYVVDSNISSNKIWVMAAGTTNAAASTPLTSISAFGGGTVQGVAVDANNNVVATDIYNVLLFTSGQINSAISGSTTVFYANEQINNPSAFTGASGIAAH